MSVTLSIFEIVVNPELVERFSQRNFDFLRADMEVTVGGMVMPITVSYYCDEGYVLEDGLHRLLAMRSLGYTEIEAYIASTWRH